MPTSKRSGLPASQPPFWEGLFRKGIAVTDFLPGYQAKPDADLKRDHALMPFLDLGERLRSAKPSDNDAAGREILIKTIEGEIIPRLMLTLAEIKGKESASDDGMLSPTEDERTRFLWTVMNESAASSRAFVNALINRGVPREAIYLDLLTGAARRLGEMWDLDQCDFTDVTIGLCRLHQILREQGVIYGNELSAAGDSPSVLLTTACGDQHVFGVVMVSEFFRRAGWRVWSEPAAPLSEIAALVGREWFDMIGLSAACDAPADQIAAEIATLRAASINPSLVVMVGGGLFQQHPDLVKVVGADATAADGRAAAELGQRLVVSALQHG